VARREWLAAWAVLVIALAAARAAHAQCTCSIADPGCSPPCASCTTQTACCTCETQCAVLAPQCNAGYTSLGTQQCTNIFQSQRECQDCATVSTGLCASCLAGYFGLSCQACPPGPGLPPCGGLSQGTCADGITGDGLCSCINGYIGNACQYSDATTCSGHGTAGISGACTCATGYAGIHCDQCAPNYFGYPSCSSICGDVNDDGTVDPNDVTLFRLHLADPGDFPFTTNGANKCTVAPLIPSLPACDMLDVTVIRRSLQNPPLGPGRAPDCRFVAP